MIVFMGVAGAGKSVQGQLLAKDLGYQWISTGEFLRKHITGKRREEMLSGRLLDDQEMIDMIGEFLTHIPDTKKAIMDGFPRTLLQAKWLHEQHNKGVIQIEAVIDIHVSKQVVTERLVARGRADDKPEVIARRYDDYQKTTLPIIQWYKDEGITVHEIHGERDIDSIHAEIMKKIRAQG